MTTISGLQIQGIRSFGPDADARQKLKFYSPLTLIVGQNGCGKTTIIECLKFITTGDYPPGCAKGSAFVHDPKLALETMVRGQVKLVFKGMNGKEMVASRSLEVHQKAKKMMCSTIDATISQKGPDGTKIQISGKCLDFETAMISQLAVSKPILEHVIFCHQEDATWPLDEGKRVKEKFDAIFSATKYIKCLENIKKVRKTQQDEVKKAVEILKSLELWKLEADKKRSDLKTQQKTLEEFAEKKSRLEEEILPIVQRLHEIKKIENDLNDIKLSIMTKKGKLESLRTAQNELRDGQNEQFTCSDGELKRMLQEFQRDVDKKEKELSLIESNTQKVLRDIKVILQKIKVTEESKQNLEFDSSNQVARVAERSHVLQEVATKYSFTEFTRVQEYDDSKAKSILSCLDQHMKEEQGIMLRGKKGFEVEENRIQSEMDTLRKKEAALEQDIKSKEKQRENLRATSRKINSDLDRNSHQYSADSLDKIKDRLSQVEEKIQQQQGKINVDKTREEIENLRKKRRTVEYKLEDHKRILKKMNQQAQARTTLDNHLKERGKLEKSIDLIKVKNKEEFEHLFGDVPGENIKNRLDACANNLRQRSSELRNEKDALTKQITKLEMRIDSANSQIKTREEDVRVIEDKIMDLCEGQDLNDALEKSKDQKERLANDRGELSSSITVLKRFSDKLKAKSCCPLCQRDFVTPEEVEMLIAKLEQKVEDLPRKLKDANTKLTQQEKHYDKMVQLKPQRDLANKTREEIAKLRANKDTALKEKEKLKDDLESKTSELALTIDDGETARKLNSDVVTMDNHLKRIKELNDQIEDLQCSLGSTDDEMNMDDAMKLQTDLDEEIKKYRDEESDLQDRLTEHSRILEPLKDSRLKLSNQQLEITTKLQEIEKLKEELKKLKSESVTIEEDLAKAKEDVAPFRCLIENKSSEKTKKTEEKEKWIDAVNRKLQEVRDHQKAANELHNGILAYNRSGKEEELLKCREKLKDLTDNACLLESDKKRLEGDQRLLERELSNQKERKRNLDDERKIREKEEEAKKLQVEISEIEKSVKDEDEHTIRVEKCNLNKKYDDKYTECSKIDGSTSTIQEEVRRLEADLRRKEVREAERNYKMKFAEKKCTEVAVDDLNKYYKALDTAIMRFHSDRMHTINGIIRELWRTTYKGNDIDHIEIKTDETESQGADKRRVFDYRVVMVKSGTEMDMRGRCSAGQKVLASLIIRMALAETFSANCGILALDEPTTNLDSENIEALSQALLSIVEKRKNQKAFQLIVITHDIEFLQKLALKDYMDYYYKISRNERGHSTIRRIDAINLN